jgi:hypothetical protein
MAWIHDLPHPLAAGLVLVVVVGASLAGLVFTRRFSRARGLHALVDNGVIGWIFSSILGIYAIAIGLIAVASWSNASHAAGLASEEASRLAAIYRDADGYPEPVREELQHDLARYTHYVIEQAWPQQRQGVIPRGGTQILFSFQHHLYAFEPQTAGQQALHAETLRAFNSLIEVRRQRLEAVTSSVPNTLWGVVLAGAALSIAASYVFSMESLRVHAAMTGLLAAMIGLLVYFIIDTDLPYRGTFGIGPGAYEIVLHDLMEPGPQ